MKAIFEFNIDEPDDRRAHMRCTKALDMALAIHDFQVELRASTAFKKIPDDTVREFEKVFYGCLERNDISIDELLN